MAGAEDEWGDYDEALFGGGGGGALDLTPLQPLIDVLTKPENMGNFEALMRDSYKFIRMTDDLNDIKAYLNDMRICFIALTVSGYIGILAYALILLCKRRRRRPAKPPFQTYPNNNVSLAAQRSFRDGSCTDWAADADGAGTATAADEVSNVLGGRRLGNSAALPPQSRHEPGFRRSERGAGLGARPHLKAPPTIDHLDPPKPTISADRQTSPGIDSYSHVVPALLKEHHGDPERGENV